MFTHPHGFLWNYGDDFVMEMATTGAAETVTIPCQNNGTFNASIDWGDGTAVSTITTWDDADLAHEYADAGDHIIRISGAFKSVYFVNDAGSDMLKLKRILNWGNTGFTRLVSAFHGCANLTSVTSESVNTSLLTSLTESFKGCTSMTTCDVSGFDLSGFSNVASMFRDCTVLTTVDFGGWDTSGITSIRTMFQSCSALTDVRIDLWDIAAVTDMDGLFFNAALSTARYDAVLIAWDAQDPVNSLTPGFGSSTYTSPGAAADARASLEGAPDLWVITDGGVAP